MLRVIFGAGTGLSAPNGTLDTRESTVNRANHRFGDPRSREEGVFFNGESPLAGFTAYFFGGVTRRHGEGAGFFRRATDDRTVRAIYPNGFLPVIQSNVTDLSGGVGMNLKTAVRR